MYACQEPTQPAKFESDILARNSSADQRTIGELLVESKAIRLAAIAMFNSFDEKILLRRYKLGV